MTDPDQDAAARAALEWATAELGVGLTVAGVVLRRRANTKTPLYEVTVRRVGGDDHVCLVDLDGHVSSSASSRPAAFARGAKVVFVDVSAPSARRPGRRL